ncbi:SDR family oxidoreductase [Bradyrhizobium sp. SRS-191]|uniref:SDR family oxidoreductase n=1 Tax=Bradyrhizobium sp. SRS-191 TaxID=2962606 RepID=UPI00211DC41B|nr:SDR family oxidoreductase [Bradyrhizobium sp. SRS-191]
MYAVTGATGQLGRKVIARLRERLPSPEIVAIVRDPGKAADLGVASRAGDYADPAGLERALSGVSKLLLISSNAFGTRQAEHANVIAAAKRAGVGHIVYTSLLHAGQWTPGFARDHVETERAIRESGLAYTILRNGWYWENHTATLGLALGHGVLIGSAGEAPISWASRRDFADAAVAVLTGAGHDGQTYELAGDRAHTLAELAAEAADQSAEPVVYQNLTEAAHAAFYERAGLPPPIAAMLAEVEAQGVASGVLRDDSRTLSRLIGRPTQSLREAVTEALAG